jgi:hypothetical protein
MTEPSPDAKGVSGLPDYPLTLEERLLGEVACASCERRLPATRSYTVLYIICIGCFVFWRVDTLFCCPQCARKYLLSRSVIALLLANVLAPIVLVWWAVQFLRTYTRAG